MIITPEITVGNILTLGSIIFGVFTFLYTWTKERNSKKKQYADLIRNAASTVLAKLERRKEISLLFFEKVQETITEADMKICKEKDVLSTRDFFWQMLVKVHSEARKEIVSEEIEIAYSTLYGYDPKIRNLFKSAIQLLDEAEDQIFTEYLLLTQKNIMEFRGKEDILYSALLGNSLRTSTHEMKLACSNVLGKIIEKFSTEVLKLIESNDADIYNKETDIKNPDELFSEFNKKEKEEK
jgi:hypothetical protein